MIVDKKHNVSRYHLIKSYYNHYINDIKFLNLLRSKFQNYITVGFKVIQNNYPINSKLKNGNLMTFFSFNHLYSYLLDLKYDLAANTVSIDDMIFYEGIKNAGNLFEIFIKNEYNFLDVFDKTVIDVGANIADTAIFFVKKGAKKVIALEPNEFNFSIAKKNIQFNNMENKIDLLPLACGDEKNVLKHAPAKSISLESLLSIENNDNLVLKLDCEGCEYETIMNTSDETLSRFTQIQIEYHYGYKNLKIKLENTGFRVFVTEPRLFLIRKREKNTSNDITFYDKLQRMDNSFLLGWLYASKK